MKQPSAKRIDDSVTISISDASLLRDYLLFAIETMNDVIADAELIHANAPIINQIREYASDAATLREKMMPAATPLDS